MALKPALEVREVTKRFRDVVAVERVSFTVQPGEIWGFIGPNGAGKTTTMRICSTLEMPDSGDVLVDGVSVLDEPRAARQRLGFMPDAYGAYPHTTVSEYLDFFARAYGLRGAHRKRTVAEVMDFTSLAPLGAKRIDAMSKGMKQRLCLAKTLLHDPSLLILDEPASGLDPRARVELRELVKALAEGGKALLISSHILSELAEMVHGVAVIERGRIRGNGAVAEIQRGLRPHATLFLRALAGPEATSRALLEEPHVSGVRPERDGVCFEFDGTAEEQAALVAALVARGVKPLELALQQADLEDIFLSLTEGQLQ